MKSIISNNIKIAEINDRVNSGEYQAYFDKTIDGVPVNKFSVKVSSAKKWDSVYTNQVGVIDKNGFVEIAR